MALTKEDEPVGLAGALNSAIVSTVGVAAFLGLDPKLVGAIAVAAGAWVTFATVWARARTTPSSKVVWTERDANAVRLGQQSPTGQ